MPTQQQLIILLLQKVIFAGGVMGFVKGIVLAIVKTHAKETAMGAVREVAKIVARGEKAPDASKDEKCLVF